MTEHKLISSCYSVSFVLSSVFSRPMEGLGGRYRERPCLSSSYTDIDPSFLPDSNEVSYYDDLTSDMSHLSMGEASTYHEGYPSEEASTSSTLTDSLNNVIRDHLYSTEKKLYDEFHKLITKSKDVMEKVALLRSGLVGQADMIRRAGGRVYICEDGDRKLLPNENTGLPSNHALYRKYMAKLEGYSKTLEKSSIKAGSLVLKFDAAWMKIELSETMHEIYLAAKRHLENVKTAFEWTFEHHTCQPHATQADMTETHLAELQRINNDYL